MKSITEKIKKALNNSDSINYVEENKLLHLGKKEDVLDALQGLVDSRDVISCQITKDKKTFNVYYSACQTLRKGIFITASSPDRWRKSATTKELSSIDNNPLISKLKLDQILVVKEMPQMECPKCKKKLSQKSFGDSKECNSCVKIHEEKVRVVRAQKMREYRARNKNEKR